MFSQMARLVNRFDSLHPTPAQQKELLDYAKSARPRFAALRAVQAGEDRIVELTFQAWQQAFPDLGEPTEYGWPTADADLRGAVRAIALGTVLDDQEFAESSVLLTLRRTLDYADVPAEAVHGLFAALVEAARESLPGDHFRACEPYFQAAANAARPQAAAV